MAPRPRPTPLFNPAPPPSSRRSSRAPAPLKPVVLSSSVSPSPLSPSPPSSAPASVHTCHATPTCPPRIEPIFVAPSDTPVSPLRRKVLVVGAGLTGLLTAYTLHSLGHSPIVLEATSRIGGSVLPLPFTNESSSSCIDLTHHTLSHLQHTRLQALLDTLAIPYDLFQPSSTSIRVAHASRPTVRTFALKALQTKHVRLQGSLSELLQKLRQPLDIRLGHRLMHVSRSDGQWRLLFRTSSSESSATSLSASSIVLALPPRHLSRLVLDRSIFPARLPSLLASIQAAPPKLLVIAGFQSPFWKRRNLPPRLFVAGDDALISEVLPVKCIDSVHMLLIDVRVSHRRVPHDKLKQAVMIKLVQFFGKEASNPVRLSVVDVEALQPCYDKVAVSSTNSNFPPELRAKVMGRNSSPRSLSNSLKLLRDVCRGLQSKGVFVCSRWLHEDVDALESLDAKLCEGDRAAQCVDDFLSDLSPMSPMSPTSPTSDAPLEALAAVDECSEDQGEEEGLEKIAKQAATTISLVSDDLP